MSDDMRCTQCGRTIDSGKAYGYACPKGMNCGPFEPISNVRVGVGTVITLDPKDARIAELERQLAEALAEALAEVQALKAELEAADHMVTAEAQASLERLARAEAAEAEVARLREALTDHNDLLRSAMQIAKREGVEGEIGSTNWDAYYNRVAVVLKRHHDTANRARAALMAPKT